MSSVATTSLGISRRKERDKVYPDIPVALLGRLAVDRKYKGQGYGGALIADMSTRLLAISHLIAIHAIVVLPIDPQAVAFYTKFGFRQLHDHEMMFIPIQTIEEAIGIAKGGA